MTTISKITLITGASSGIGVDLAFEFAKRGHNLVLLARRENRLKEVQEDLAKTFPNISVHIMVQDLLEESSIQRIRDFLRNNHLELEYLVNNAGFGLRGEFHKLSGLEQTNMINLNVTRLTQLCHHFLPEMVDHNAGGIMNVASVAGFQPGPKMSVYFATKAFVLFLTEGIHEEIKATNIKVSALCPGPTESEFGKVADMDGTRLFDHGVMKSSTVAKIGVDGFFANQAVVITGTKNKILAFANRFAPRSMVRKIAHYLQK